MSKSTYSRNKHLDHEFGGTPYVPPTAHHISLHTADPGTTGANECTGNNYGRKSYTNTTANWPAASGGAKSNGAGIQFARATVGSSGWGTATHFGIWDAASAGNYIRGGAIVDPATGLPSSILVQGGDAPYIPIGYLDLTET